jgi:hypothetical protein
VTSDTVADRARAVRRRIDPADLRDLVEALPGPRNRFTAPAAMDAAVDLVHGWLTRAGWRTHLQPVDLRAAMAEAGRAFARNAAEAPAVIGTNVVARLPGRAPEGMVVVGAHLDTVDGSPGADDNGSGVAALVALARVLAERRLKRSVVLAVFDFEEVGFHGARRFVASLRGDLRVVAALIYETMGYTDHEPDGQAVPAGIEFVLPRQVRRLRARSSRGDFTAVIHRRSSTALARTLAEALAAVAGEDAALVLRDPADLPLVGRVLHAAVPAVRNFARSDHIPFWEAGMPAVQLTDTANFRNPNYHAPSDTPDTLDYDHLATIVAASVAAVEEAAGALD